MLPIFGRNLKDFFIMLGRTKKEKASAYKGMAVATAILIFVPAVYVYIDGMKRRLLGGM
jgi:hypothetical protein